MVSVAGDAVAADFAVDLGTPGLGMLVFLQHQSTGALAHDKAIAAGVKGHAGSGGVLGGGQSLHIGEASHADGQDGRFRAAGEHSVQIAVLHSAVSLANGVVARSAGGDDGNGSSLEIVLDGDESAGHVDDHAGNEEGGHPAGALLHEHALLLGKGLHAADAGAKVSADPLRGEGILDAALLHGLGGRSHCVPAEHVILAQVGFLHVLQGIEVLHLGGHFHLVIRGVKVGDGPDAAFAGLQALPKGGHVVADGGDAAHAGDNHSSHIARPPSTRMVSPVM